MCKSSEDSCWYYSDGFSRFGPIDNRELTRMYLDGDVDEDVQVWCADQDDWMRLGETDTFRNIISKIPTIEQNTGNSSCWKPTQYWQIKYRTPHIAFFTLTAFLVLLCIIYYDHLDYTSFKTMFDSAINTAESNKPQITFLAYTSLYLGVWVAYFLSRSPYPLLQVATLRRLLEVTSLQWHGDPSESNTTRKSYNLIMTEREEAFRRKGGTAITALAMLVAASLLELIAANNIYMASKTGSLILDQWQYGTLVLVALFSFTAFISFIVAVDALESMFNRFAHRDWAHQLIIHFYQRSVNPRYYGFASLIAATILLISIHSVMLACIAIVLAITVGMPHWFPDPQLISNEKSRPGLHTVLGRSLFAGFSLFIIFIFFQ